MEDYVLNLILFSFLLILTICLSVLQYKNKYFKSAIVGGISCGLYLAIILHILLCG